MMCIIMSSIMMCIIMSSIMISGCSSREQEKEERDDAYLGG